MDVADIIASASLGTGTVHGMVVGQLHVSRKTIASTKLKQNESSSSPCEIFIAARLFLSFPCSKAIHQRISLYNNFVIALAITNLMYSKVLKVTL